MQSEISKAIIQRFMKSFDYLKASGITTKTEFCRKYDIDMRNFYKIEHSTRTAIELSWLYYLCTEYKVSAYWILTGEGSFFIDPIVGQNLPLIKHNE